VADGSTPYMPYRGWQMFGAILLAIAGIIVIVAPFESLFTLAVVAGVSLVVIGVWEIVEAFIARKHGTELLRSQMAAMS